MDIISDAIVYFSIESNYKVGIYCVEEGAIICSIFCYAHFGQIITEKMTGNANDLKKVTDSVEYEKRKADLIEFSHEILKIKSFSLGNEDFLIETNFFSLSEKHIQFKTNGIEPLTFEISFHLRVPIINLVYFKGQHIDVRADENLIGVFEEFSNWLLNKGENRLRLY